MPTKHRALALFLYALAVIASGLWRYTTQEGGEKGLWFGLVMGGLGLVGAGLLRAGRTRPGMGLAIVTLAFVGGWFAYESFVDKGLAHAEIRQLILIGLSIVMAVILWLPHPAHESATEQR